MNTIIKTISYSEIISKYQLLYELCLSLRNIQGYIFITLHGAIVKLLRS
jgi:hypothetical protein